MSAELAANVPSERFRWWFLPSWLGLDAPVVVSTWTWAASCASGVPMRVRPVAAMFLVVWFIYLSDRLIDVARCRDWTHATGRLTFGRDHRRLFLACRGGCLGGSAWLLWAGLPPEVIARAVVVACGVLLHAFLFVIPVFFRKKLPGKEFGVGSFFALGAYACLGELRQTWPFLLSIALVVAFNCLVIAARDADSDSANDPGGASRWWSTLNRDLLWLGVALTVASALAALVIAPVFYSSLATAFALLTALHSGRRRFGGDAVRALADFALLPPLPIIAAMSAEWRL